MKIDAQKRIHPRRQAHFTLLRWHSGVITTDISLKRLIAHLKRTIAPGSGAGIAFSLLPLRHG